MNAVFGTVLLLSLSGGMTILLLFALRPLCRGRLGRTWMFYMWAVALLRLAVPLSLPLPEPAGALRARTAQSAPAAAEPAAEPAPDAAAATPAPEPAAPRAPADAAAPGLADALWIIWLGGAAVLLVQRATSYRAFLRFIRAGSFPDGAERVRGVYRAVCGELRVRRPPELLVNRLAASPLLAGVRRPILVLPQTDLSEGELRLVFRHELTHYRRRDLWYKWAAQLVLCLHWFNPLVHLAVRQLGRDCELACDEAVLRPLDRAQRQRYGDTLLRCVRGGGDYASVAEAATLSEDLHLLTERLDAIMKFHQKKKPALLAGTALALAVCLAAAPFGAYAPAQPSPAPILPAAARQTTAQADFTTPAGAVRGALEALSRLDMKTFNAHTDNRRQEKGLRYTILFGDLKDRDLSKETSKPDDYDELYYRKAVERFSFTIGEAAASGGNATVPVTVTNADQSGAVEEMTRLAMQSTLRDEDFDPLKLLYEQACKAAESGKTVSASFNISLKLDSKSGEWKMHIPSQLTAVVIGFDTEQSDPDAWKEYVPGGIASGIAGGIVDSVVGGIVDSVVGGIVGGIMGGIMGGIRSGAAPWNYGGYGDGNYADLPEELYLYSDGSTSGRSGYFTFEVKEPTEMTVTREGEADTFTLSVRGADTGRTVAAPARYDEPGSFTLQPGSYRIDYAYTYFEGYCEVVGAPAA